MSADYDSLSPGKKALAKFLMVVLLVGITVLACTSPDVVKMGYESGYSMSEQSKGAIRRAQNLKKLGDYREWDFWVQHELETYLTIHQPDDFHTLKFETVDFGKGLIRGIEDSDAGRPNKYKD